MQIEAAEFVWFRYAPDYLRNFEHLATTPNDIMPIPEIKRVVESEIVLDGGNIVRWGGRCIVTEKVFTENPGLGREELTRKLQALLRVDDLIVIPREPYDKLGHADGVVQFIDEGTVAINDYSKVAPRYRKGLTFVLRQSGLRWFEIPYFPQEEWVGDIPPAFGCYVNFLLVSGLVVLPGYGIAADRRMRQIMKWLAPASTVSQIDCRNLSVEGGSLHCVTWTCKGHLRSMGEGGSRPYGVSTQQEEVG